MGLGRKGGEGWDKEEEGKEKELEEALSIFSNTPV
jgi:hypothetical protein